MDEREKFIDKVSKGKLKPLKPADKFQFECQACGRCCFENAVLLTTYDVVRLRNSLKLTTTEILKKDLVNLYIGHSSGLPILSINFVKAKGAKITKCPFLTPVFRAKDMEKIMGKKIEGESGLNEFRQECLKNPDKLFKQLDKVRVKQWICGVYPDRPIICRLFPLGRAKKFDKDWGAIQEEFYLQEKTDWCKGWETKESQTLKSFFKKAEIDNFREGSDAFQKMLGQLTKNELFVHTKDNKGGIFKEDDKGVLLIGNLLYNFDSFTPFSEDPAVARTIYDDHVSHEQFMDVVSKVDNLLDKVITGSFEGLKREGVKLDDRSTEKDKNKKGTNSKSKS